MRSFPDVETHREINIKGSYVGNRQDTAEAIEFFRRGLIKAPYKYVPFLFLGPTILLGPSLTYTS